MQNNTGFEIDNSGIDPQTNFSANAEFADILAGNLQRRSFLKGTLGTAGATVFGGSLIGCNSSSSPAPVALPAADPVPDAVGMSGAAARGQRVAAGVGGAPVSSFRRWMMGSKSWRTFSCSALRA